MREERKRKQKEVHPQKKFDLLLYRFALASLIHFQRKDAHFPQSAVEMLSEVCETSSSGGQRRLNKGLACPFVLSAALRREKLDSVQSSAL